MALPELLEPPVIDDLISRITPDVLGDLPARLAQQIYCRLAANGTVTNAPDQLTITGTLVSTGVYELTAPVGYTWFSAVGVGVASGAPRTVNCNVNSPGGRILRCYVFNESGAPASVEHNVIGLLVLA